MEKAMTDGAVNVKEAGLEIREALRQTELFPIDVSTYEKYRESISKATDGGGSFDFRLLSELSTKDCKVCGDNLYLRNVKNVNAETQRKITDAVREIIKNPNVNSIFAKRLSGKYSGFWQSDIGKFSLIYRLMPDNKNICLCAFGKQQEVFKMLWKK